MSRWLDPANVAVGSRPMSRCLEFLQAHIPCPYPPTPGKKGLCAACLDRCEERTDPRPTPTLPPNELKPAPRWPARGISRLPVLRPAQTSELRAYWSGRTYARTPESPRVPKVRPLNSYSEGAGWVRA